MEPIDLDLLQGSLETLLRVYPAVRSSTKFGREPQIWSLFERIQTALAASDPLIKRPGIRLRWSVGQGRWAASPWLRLSDSRGRFSCRYILSKDMSSVAFQLEVDAKETSSLENLRRRCSNLQSYGFQLAPAAGLGRIGRAVIASKIYPAKAVPDDGELLHDLELLLQSASELTSRRPPPKRKAVQPMPVFDIASAVEKLILDVASRGFIYEPWQIAAYVAALRTKPFVILAGVSGTGKSQLPALVAEATGGISELIPVRPDWSDSSDLLGYVDLQGVFRPGQLLEVARRASEQPDRYFVCVIDEMNIARVEHYFAEVLSRLEARRQARAGGYETSALLGGTSKLDRVWAQVTLPANLAIVGTVNMDESTHTFSRKVLDRAFTLEFSELELTVWRQISSELKHSIWPARAWYPEAVRLGGLTALSAQGRDAVRRCIEALTTINRMMVQAQLQFGYRTRDEASLFLIHALQSPQAFRSSSGAMVDPLDLVLQMKILPRIAGGSNTIRRLLRQLLGWAHHNQPLTSESEADALVEQWLVAGCPSALPDADYPRTASRLCMMWERLQSEGFTSFWL